MRKLDIAYYDLQELNSMELVSLNGGGKWNNFMEDITRLITPIYFPILLWMGKDNSEEYYGGELDPAVCEG